MDKSKNKNSLGNKFSYYRRVWPSARKILLHEAKVFLSQPRWMRFCWESIDDCAVKRVESARVQHGRLLYVIGGYITLDKVHSGIDVLDLSTGKWKEPIALPETIAQTHCGIASESERYIYFISGQVGIQCSPAVNDCHVFDLVTRQWRKLPPLPQKRYAPVVQLCAGRIHVTAGSKEDRVSPTCEHWSLGVKDGQALEHAWREEPPIPLGGPHRSHAIIGDKIYVLGSQYYDRPPVAGDPKFTCDWKAPKEIFFQNSYVYSLASRQWRRIKDMPFAATHTEYSTAVINGKIVVLGGFIGQEMLTDLIQVYDPAADRWRIAGRLPWRNKGLVFGLYDDWLYVLTGQTGEDRWNARFGDVLKSGFRTRFNISEI